MPSSARTVRTRRRTNPRIAPASPGARSAIWNVLTRSATSICAMRAKLPASATLVACMAVPPAVELDVALLHEHVAVLLDLAVVEQQAKLAARTIAGRGPPSSAPTGAVVERIHRVGVPARPHVLVAGADVDVALVGVEERAV